MRSQLSETIKILRSEDKFQKNEERKQILFEISDLLDIDYIKNKVEELNVEAENVNLKSEYSPENIVEEYVPFCNKESDGISIGMEIDSKQSILETQPICKLYEGIESKMKNHDGGELGLNHECSSIVQSPPPNQSPISPIISNPCLHNHQPLSPQISDLFHENQNLTHQVQSPSEQYYAISSKIARNTFYKIASLLRQIKSSKVLIQQLSDILTLHS